MRLEFCKCNRVGRHKQFVLVTVRIANAGEQCVHVRLSYLIVAENETNYERIKLEYLD